MLAKCDGGIVTHTAQQTADAVASILTNDGAVGRRMRASMAKFSVPDAALRTAKASLAVADAK